MNAQELLNEIVNGGYLDKHPEQKARVIALNGTFCAPPKCEKCNGLARLLVECRDALPAITTVRARLYSVDLTLADRIESALKPWEVVQ